MIQKITQLILSTVKNGAGNEWMAGWAVGRQLPLHGEKSSFAYTALGSSRGSRLRNVTAALQFLQLNQGEYQVIDSWHFYKFFEEKEVKLYFILH